MQSVQRTSLHDVPPAAPASLATALATLVDRRVRVGRETASPERSGPDGNVLIWLDHPVPGSGLVASGRRGVIVVMHGANQAVAARSFVVSFPVGAGPVENGDTGRQLGAVSKLLAGLGWLLLASDRRKTELGHADTAVLVTSGFGGEQSLWLAEPVEPTPKASLASTQHPVRPTYWSDASSNLTA